MVQLVVIGKVTHAYPRNVTLGMKIMNLVYVCCSKLVKHPKLKEATVYSMISFLHSDSSYTMDPC